MKNYAAENASFQLPFTFDTTALKADLEKCRSFDFLANYIPENYTGTDYILPLRSIEGRIDFPVAVAHQADQYQDTKALEACTYFQEVINQFQCEKEAIRLMSLPPGAAMNTHTDLECGYEDGLFRIHVPILTNDAVEFIVNDERIAMQEGQTWYANFNLPHSVANNGKSHRVHLVIDCIRNEWSDALFKSMGYNFDLEHETTQTYTEETTRLIIQELKRQNSPEAKKLIESLKSQLKNT